MYHPWTEFKQSERPELCEIAIGIGWCLAAWVAIGAVVWFVTWII